MSKPTLKVTDFTDDFNAVVKRFKRDNVLVGIPEEKSNRNEKGTEVDEPINNAAILAINNFGSEENNIPARPVMEIGIRNAQEQIAEEYKKALQAAWKTGVGSLITYYNRAGIIASNSIKKAINSQDGIDEPSEATLAARKAVGFKGTKALIVTGQMRNAITYVVKGGV